MKDTMHSWLGSCGFWKSSSENIATINQDEESPTAPSGNTPLLHTPADLQPQSCLAKTQLLVFSTLGKIKVASNMIVVFFAANAAMNYYQHDDIHNFNNPYSLTIASISSLTIFTITMTTVYSSMINKRNTPSIHSSDETSPEQPQSTNSRKQILLLPPSAIAISGKMATSYFVVESMLDKLFDNYRGIKWIISGIFALSNGAGFIAWNHKHSQNLSQLKQHFSFRRLIFSIACNIASTTFNAYFSYQLAHKKDLNTYAGLTISGVIALALLLVNSLAQIVTGNTSRTNIENLDSTIYIQLIALIFPILEVVTTGLGMSYTTLATFDDTTHFKDDDIFPAQILVYATAAILTVLGMFRAWNTYSLPSYHKVQTILLSSKCRLSNSSAQQPALTYS